MHFSDILCNNWNFKSILFKSIKQKSVISVM